MSAESNSVLQIDPEFESKIPMPTEDEYRKLKENIVSEGAVLDSLIVWNDTIVDGHNRYKIVQEHPEIIFTVHENNLCNRYEAEKTGSIISWKSIHFIVQKWWWSNWPSPKYRRNKGAHRFRDWNQRKLCQTRQSVFTGRDCRRGSVDWFPS